MHYKTWLDNWRSGDHGEHYRMHGPQDGDAIAGCATNYSPEEIQIFTTSLRSHHDGPACLMVHEDPAVLDHLRAHKIDAFLIQRTEPDSIHIVVRRFAYLLTLLERQTGWRSVFCCDVRDLMFQASPFNAPLEHQVEAYQEREIGTINEHAFTKKWVQRCFGEHAFRRIAHAPALCVGTVLGERDALARVLRIMLRLQEIPRSAIGGSFGADQASFNLAIHDGMVDAKVIANHERVSTIGAHLAALEISADNQLVRKDGFMPPVIHQFDRDPDFTRAIEKQVGLPFVTQLAQKSAPVSSWLSRRLHSIRLRLPESR